MIFRRLYYWLLLALIWCSVPINGQQRVYDIDSMMVDNPYFEPLMQAVCDTFQFFGPEMPLEFTVTTDFRTLTKNKFKEEYQEATVSFDLWDSLRITRKVRVKPRGEFRLKECRYPPLWVNSKQTKEVFEVLDQLDKVKMVIPCKGPDSYQQYIFNEYLAYKLYNLISDYSFRARLIKVNYQDAAGKVKPGNGYTFIIESEKSLANRMEAIPIKNEKISAKLTHQELAIQMYLFQFMIGNTDWSVPGLHNVKLLKTKSPLIPNPIAVPYDFDYCGLVNATYAIPGDHVSIESVTEREYMGYCCSEEAIFNAISKFQAQESEILATVSEFPWLNDYEKKKSVKYLEDFFAIIDDPKKVNQQIIRVCKN